MRHLVVLVGLLFFPLSAIFGQGKSEIIQQRIEFISERYQSENIDLTNIIEQLDYYFEHPINLNYLRAEE